MRQRERNEANIGKTDQANHQYDISDFFDAINRVALPRELRVAEPWTFYIFACDEKGERLLVAGESGPLSG